MKTLIIKVYSKVKDNYWRDPVWSKVISSGIVVILGSTFTYIYLLAKTLIDKISFKEAFLQLISLLKGKSLINNFIIFVGSLVILFTIIRSFIKFYSNLSIKAQQDNKEGKAGEGDKKLPIANYKSTVFFNYRLAKAFPGQRGLKWYDNPKIAVERLSILFKEPLNFRSGPSEFSSQPIWWFRGYSSMYIRKIKIISKTKILLDKQELEIKRIAVNVDIAYHKCFIYVEVLGEKQTGLYNFQPTDIKKHVETFGYSWEEYGLINKKPIRREEYDDGAATIKNKVVDASNADLRIRYLTDYNFIIAAHESPYNSDKIDVSETWYNEILKGEKTAESFLAFLCSFNTKAK